MPEKQLIPFQFEKHPLSAITDGNGDPWFVAKDACAILGISDVSQACERLEDDEKQLISCRDAEPFNTRAVHQELKMLIISEAGLYRLAMGSRKKIAKKFQRWIAHEVNPEVRKTGGYSLHTQVSSERIAQELKGWLEIGEMLGTPIHIIQIIKQEAVKQIEAALGVSIKGLLSSAAAQNQIAATDEMFEPTELAQRLQMPSAYALNLALEKLGWQVKRIGGGWEATPQGVPHAARHAWIAERGTKSGYNWKWRLENVREALLTHGLLKRA